MAIDTITPAQNNVIDPGDSVSFTVDDTYTTLTIQVKASGGTELAYSTASGTGGGYTVSVSSSGGRDTFTVARTSGWDKTPQEIIVTEDESGASVQTTLTYTLTAVALYSQGSRPYNSETEGTLTLSEDDVVTRTDVGHIDFDGATFNLTDQGVGKVKVTGVGGGGGGVTTDGTTAQDAALFTERADHVNAPAATKGEIWLQSGTLQELRFTDDFGTDYYLARTSGTITDGGVLTSSGATTGDTTVEANVRVTGGRLLLDGATNDITITEKSSGNTPNADEMAVWVSDTVPQELMVTDGTGADRKIAYQDGTEAANQFAYFETANDGKLTNSNALGVITGSKTIYNNQAGGGFRLFEGSSRAYTPPANYGFIWIKDNTPNSLIFSDDAGGDTYVTGGKQAITLGAAATTFAVTGRFMEITGDAGANTIATITGAADGQVLTLLFVDGLVTITDDNTHAADSIDLSAAFTSADDTVLQLIYDGTSWYEISRSVN